MANSTRITLIFLAVLFFSGIADAQLMDSAWPKFHQNLNNTGQSPYSSTSDGTVKWTYSFAFGGAGTVASPVLDSDGTIYIDSSNGFYAVYSNGTLKWSNDTLNFYYSTFAIDTSGIIYGESLSDGKVHAYYPNGTEKWGYTIGQSVRSSPTIDSNGIIYIGGTDLNWVKNLYAIYPNGSLKWNHTLDTTVGFRVYGAPAIDSNSVVYIGTENGKLSAVYPNGTSKWNYTTENGFYSSPAVGADGTVYIGDYGGKLYAIYPNGTSKWNYTAGGAIGDSSPAISSSGIIYIGSHDDKLYAVYPNGTSKWNYTTGDDIDSSPAIDSNGIVYFTSYNGYIYAVYPDGTLKWSYFVGLISYSSPAIGSDGSIYVTNSELYAFESQPPTYDPSGYVKDQSGSPIQGVNITYGSTTVWSNATGWYDFGNSFPNGTYSYSVKHGWYNTQTGSITIQQGGNIKNYTLVLKCSVNCSMYNAKNGSDLNTGLDWGNATFNVSTGVNYTGDFGTLHIGYGNYSNQTTINGSRPIEYWCDSSGYQENPSEPWCDMPGVEP